MDITEIVSELVKRYHEGIKDSLPSYKLELSRSHGKMIDEIHIVIDGVEYTISENELKDEIGDTEGSKIKNWIKP